MSLLGRTHAVWCHAEVAKEFDQLRRAESLKLKQDLRDNDFMIILLKAYRGD